MSINSKMTAIADAIRSKTGGTEALSLDGMAAAIAGIQTGGGGSGIQSASGTYTLAADATAMDIDITDIGFIPDIAVVSLDETELTYTNSPTKAWMLSYMPDLLDRSGVPTSSTITYAATNIGFLWRGAQGTNVPQNATTTVNYVGTRNDETGIYIHVNRSSSVYPIIAGNYKWYAYKIWEDAA